MLQAAAIGKSGQVLVLDMGEVVKIVDLARDLIRLAGHTVEEMPIVFSGLRPGEKLYEELLADADDTVPTAVERLRVARLSGQSAGLGELLQWIAGAASAGDAEVQRRLQRVVPEYRLRSTLAVSPALPASA